MAMKVSVLHKWLEWLRSGNFTQCSFCLHIKDDGYCCLGVLARSLGWDKNKLIGRVYIVHPSHSLHKQGLTDCGLNMSPEEAGVSDNEQCKLSVMNDSGKYTFKQIADWAEENIATIPG